MGVVQVRVDDLLGVGEGFVQAAPDNGEVFAQLLVGDEVALLMDVLVDLAAQRRIADGGQATTGQPREPEHFARGIRSELLSLESAQELEGERMVLKENWAMVEERGRSGQGRGQEVAGPMGSQPCPMGRGRFQRKNRG